MRVLDTHLGTGTFAVAAVRANIHGVGYELTPEFLEVAKGLIFEMESNCGHKVLPEGQLKPHCD